MFKTFEDVAAACDKLAAKDYEFAHGDENHRAHGRAEGYAHIAILLRQSMEVGRLRFPPVASLPEPSATDNACVGISVLGAVNQGETSEAASGQFSRAEIDVLKVSLLLHLGRALKAEDHEAFHELQTLYEKLLQIKL